MSAVVPLSSSAFAALSVAPLGGNAQDGMNQINRMRRDFSKQVSEASQNSENSTTSTAHSLEELSSQEFFERQCAEIDAMASRVVDESSVKEAVRRVAVDDVHFCVTIADPMGPDVPLLAVSDMFESITGYTREEVLGKNCRFLSNGCHSRDPASLARIRNAISTGSSMTAVLTNRRKSGELFLNLLDLRGLTVARNPSTGKELWFLVGIQADVTGVGLAQLDADLNDYLEEMRRLAGIVRTKLAMELSKLAVAGALQADFRVTEHREVEPPDAWVLLPMATWRNECQDPWLPKDLGIPCVKGEKLCEAPGIEAVEKNAQAAANRRPSRFFERRAVACAVAVLGGLVLAQLALRPVPRR